MPVNDQNGLTLVETLTTVTLISIALVVVMPNLASVQRSSELNGLTKLAASWLDNLRREAIQKSVPCEASWNFNESTLISSCEKEDTTDTLDLKESTSKEISVINANDTGSTVWIFTPRGTSNTAGEVIIKLENEPGSCLKLSEPLGLISTGKQSSTGSCDYTKNF